MKAKDLKRIGISRDVTKGLIQRGFISPEKDGRGNYEYTEEEVKYLKRYMVLRAADVHQEEIRKIEGKEITLAEALKRREGEMKSTIERLNLALEICEALIEEEITYEELLERSEYYGRYVKK